MTHNEVDAWRRRELTAWDRDYRILPWHVIGPDAQQSWINRYKEAHP